MLHLAAWEEPVYKLSTPPMHSDDGTEEIRSAVRFPLRLSMAVRGSNQKELRAETDNISSGGVLFKVAVDLQVGSRIEFTIDMPAQQMGSEQDVKVNCVGRVVRCAPEGDRKSIAAIIDEYRVIRA